MAELTIADKRWEIDLVIFDKDGTLIDFNGIWAGWYRGALTYLQQAAPALEGLAEMLNETLGYDPKSGRILPDSPLAVASTREINVLISGTLYRAGLNWTEANEATEQASANDDGHWRSPELIKPIGDVKGTFQRLKAAGIHIAIATSDDRQPTIETLDVLSLSEMVDVIVCGDDPLPHKPHPAGYELICGELNIDPGRSIMVGDTLNDIRFGQNNGAAATLGISVGAGAPDVLQASATWVAESIEFLCRG